MDLEKKLFNIQEIILLLHILPMPVSTFVVICGLLVLLLFFFLDLALHFRVTVFF